MNEHAIALQALMQKDVLTPKEVKEGVVTCFFAVNRDFVKRRMGMEFGSNACVPERTLVTARLHYR